jgi:hypothetical protein
VIGVLQALSMGSDHTGLGIIRHLA